MTAPDPSEAPTPPTAPEGPVSAKGWAGLSTLDRYRALIAWCEAHGVESIAVYPWVPGQAYLSTTDFERIVGAAEVSVTKGDYSDHHIATVDGVEIVALYQAQTEEHHTVQESP